MSISTNIYISDQYRIQNRNRKSISNKRLSKHKVIAIGNISQCKKSKEIIPTKFQ